MRETKKYWSVLAATLIVALAVGACKKEDKDETEDVPADPDIAAVERVKRSLTAGRFTFASGDNEVMVRKNFSVPTALGSITVTWQSSSTVAMISGGQVTVDPIDVDQNVDLTATLTKGAVTATKVIPVKVKKGTLYFVGYKHSASNDIPGFWELSKVFTALTRKTTNGTGHKATKGFVDGTDIYFSGITTDAGKFIGAYWKNGTRVDLPGLEVTEDSAAYALGFNGVDVLTAGESFTAGPLPHAGVWTGTVWGELTQVMSATDIHARDIKIKGANVYVLGEQNAGAGFVAGHWLNGTWVAYTQPDSGETFATAFALKSSEVFAVGRSYGASEVYGVLWVDGDPTLLKGPTNEQAQAYDIHIDGEDVYVAGTLLDTNNGMRVPGYWKNGTWVGDVPPTTEDSIVSSILVKGGNVYLGGGKYSVNPLSTPGYWKNGTWVELDSTASTDSSLSDIILGPPL